MAHRYFLVCIPPILQVMMEQCCQTLLDHHSSSEAGGTGAITACTKKGKFLSTSLRQKQVEALLHMFQLPHRHRSAITVTRKRILETEPKCLLAYSSTNIYQILKSRIRMEKEPTNSYRQVKTEFNLTLKSTRIVHA